MVDALELEPGLRVLELGSGPGRLAIEIKRACPDVSVEGVDIDPTMIERARKNAEFAGVDVSFTRGDMTCLGRLGAYDRVVSTMTFHHLSPDAKDSALACAREALAPGGRFVVTDFGRPRGPLQWALFSFIQQPLDGFRNTSPHRTGHFERIVRATFASVDSAAAWRTVAGTLEMFVCEN